MDSCPRNGPANNGKNEKRQEIRGALELLQLLGAYLLDLRLPDLIGHPGRGAGGLVYLHTLALEQVYLLRATLTEPDICIAPVGRF